MNSAYPSLTPPLKWAGGKRWLARKHASAFPVKFDRYIEPFVGGGAVFFALRPSQALISDINPLIATLYRALKSNYETVHDKLKLHSQNHSNDYYYCTRASRPTDDASIAAWLLYLNRTCYNGLYRVNLRGEFNVPRGTKDKILFDYDDFSGVSEALRGTEITHGDFEIVLSQAKDGDFVYIDPPYTVMHNNNGFIKYNENIFSWRDQERLAYEAQAAADRGAMILISNADHKSIWSLYEGRGTISAVARHSVIGGGAAYRSQSSELLIRLGY
ncbi:MULTISPECIES: Dam family site-specific DNA-(adenine-N6)-methyltransferase [unclassified Bosea (in: a-proteobacteria)]|uniref:DNA adenine methylase n=1 Tax=unclassified Bosea (in: a-proteobacteria) TaxID=2653178 RepID=UPI000F7DB84F|nr:MULTISPECIES: Dam family site-specific DNA-(adenine-N6)-methyltransferase [unclassified Bosea (in: a-proteobacteria)]RXT21717.1 DNA methyltransferase [Bosea sp. Tri-39]RXT32056.1 DNA methyltransferase [Bosea sp. Tri-54]